MRAIIMRSERIPKILEFTCLSIFAALVNSSHMFRDLRSVAEIVGGQAIMARPGRVVKQLKEFSKNLVTLVLVLQQICTSNVGNACFLYVLWWQTSTNERNLATGKCMEGMGYLFVLIGIWIGVHHLPRVEKRGSWVIDGLAITKIAEGSVSIIVFIYISFNGKSISMLKDRTM